MTSLLVKSVFGKLPEMQAPFEGQVRVVAFTDDRKSIALSRLDLRKPCAPMLVSVREFSKALEGGQIIELEEPNWQLPISESQLPGKRRQAFIAARELMAPFIGLSDEEQPIDEAGRPLVKYDMPKLILNAHHRRVAFREASELKGVSEKTLERKFYRFLKYGMTVLALAGPQKPRGQGPKWQKPGSKKRGRKPRSGADVAPTPTSAEVKDRLKPYCRKFLEGKLTLQAAYHLSLLAHFSIRKMTAEELARIERREDLSIEEIENHLVPKDQRPTLDQFRYIAEKIRIESGIEKTKSIRELRPRQMPSSRRGRARDWVRGPAFEFEIDSTKLQRRMTSRIYPHRVLASSTEYVVVDKWSTAIVARFPSLDHPSFNLGAAALRACLQDKGEIFRDLGLPYGSDQLPTREAPSRLIVDRAEFVSNKAKPICDLGIQIRPAASGNAAGKGTIEGTFSGLKHGRARQHLFLPGEYPKFPKRGEDDGMHDACLDTDDSERRSWEVVLQYNAQPVPAEDFPPDALGMGLENISRIDLYLWGLKNRPGGPFLVSKRDEITYLMQQGFATVTPDGINFAGQSFDCPTFNKVAYLRRSSDPRIEIRFDNLVGHFIYILDDTVQDWAMAMNQNQEYAALRYTLLELQDFKTEYKKKASQKKFQDDVNASIRGQQINRETRALQKAAIARRKGHPKSGAHDRIRETTARELEIEHAQLASREISKYQSRQSQTHFQNGPGSSNKLVRSSEPKDRPKASARTVAMGSGKLFERHYARHSKH